MTKTFHLTEEELNQLNAWKESLPEVPEEFLDVFGKEYQYIYQFQPTGLGVVKIVRRVYDDAEINLTTYDDW